MVRVLIYSTRAIFKIYIDDKKFTIAMTELCQSCHAYRTSVTWATKSPITRCFLPLLAVTC